jgi:poly-gamma-glutamate synthesis protein (capsule biosynthesis protein)
MSLFSGFAQKLTWPAQKAWSTNLPAVWKGCLYLLLACSLLALPGEPVAPTHTLVFVGDVMLGRGVARELNGDWQAAFAGVQPWLVQADLAFANLESPLTSIAPGGKEVGEGYDLRAPPESVVALHAAGFDVVSLGNNHALDAGDAGLAQTIATLNAAQITALPTYQSTNMLPYRFLALDDSTAALDLESALSIVSTAAKQGDVVIVSIHWGGEYQAAPGPRQLAVARALADAGADVVVGHGPHTLQRAEWIGETLVAYSLGNFLFDQPYPVDCGWGAILRLTLQGGQIVAVEAIPTVTQQGRVRPAAPGSAADVYVHEKLDPTIASNIQENKP